ncbi:hypothetical protein BBJ29_008516 [Phytophthora kernoviae]|uniref:WW domain-containing protein n=1 Tax=Phytophthora kernoviae TaxID=325452 RepID=A0A3R7HAC2_9STRA|nr:hypothetical protein BBJ29_008516 [Phytophthora kernoviae]
MAEIEAVMTFLVDAVAATGINCDQDETQAEGVKVMPVGGYLWKFPSEVSTLLLMGFDCNLQNHEQESPLLLVAASGDHATMRALLAVPSIQVNLPCAFGVTAFHAAANAGDVKMLQLLCNAGAQPELQDENGWTALHYTAASSMGLEAIHFLCELLPDGIIDSLCCEGNTALHVAAGCGHLANVYALLQTAANPRVRNFSGESSYHLALRNNHIQCAVVINEYQNMPPPSVIEPLPRPPKESALSEATTVALNEYGFQPDTQCGSVEWIESFTEEGYAYYYNAVSGESSWYKPEEYQTLGTWQTIDYQEQGSESYTGKRSEDDTIEPHANSVLAKVTRPLEAKNDFLTFALTVASAFKWLAPISVEAHSWLVKPVSRDTGPRTTDGTIGCPNTTPGSSTSFSPGEIIDVRYWRNNHLGGFIRWSLSPAGSETASDFDDNVFFYTCRESGPDCVPADGSPSRYAGDSSSDNTISCGDTITLPDWLDEGDYVLQWVWFGVGSSYGNIGWAEPQFVSCADITLTTTGSGSEPTCPTFVGGDRVTKNEDLGDDKCFYFYTNSIESTQYKGSNEYYEQYYIFGKPSYVEDCSGNTADAGNSTSTPSTESPSTAAPSSSTDSTETETPTTTPNQTAYPTSTPQASSTASSVAGDASDAASESDDGEYSAGTVDPGDCKTKRRPRWT